MLAKVTDRLTRFKSANRDLNSKHSNNMEVVYSLNNLQAVLYHISVLNDFIGSPCQDFDIITWWNGTSVFNIYNDLDGYCDVGKSLFEI